MVLDDPEQNRGSEVLLGLPALEGGGEFFGMVVFDEEINTLSSKFTLGDLK